MNNNREMKSLAVAVFSVLLLSMGYTANSQSFATTVQEEKNDIILELNELKNDSEFSKKSKKELESVIKKLEKSLDSKYWKDESTVNFKHGKKILDADKNAVKKIEKLEKDKKIPDSIKNKLSDIKLKIIILDKIILGNSITSISEITMSQKGLKKIEKAKLKFEKGNESLENEKYLDAITKYSNSWKQVKLALKDPHYKKIKLIELEGVADMNFDDIPDVYLKVSKSKKDNKPKLLEMKITGECVNGIDHESARMKIGLSTPVNLSTEFFDEGFEATNKWFKQNDPDKRINPVVITTISEYFSFPDSGDNLIQINEETGKESFSFSVEPISEIGDQSGWTGNFSFDGEPGDYSLHFWFPLTEPTKDGDSCNFVSSFSIPTGFE